MKAGLRYEKTKFVSLDIDTENFENTIVTSVIDGESTEYSLGGGSGGATGSFTLEMFGFPTTMHAGETYQIGFTVSDGATMEFKSSASSSKISIDENGLMTCIGNTTGACGINIKAYNTDGGLIGDVHTKVTVA